MTVLAALTFLGIVCFFGVAFYLIITGDQQ